ncbi:MAG TPA: hypothetical protein VLH84_00980 [Patescibacteria group bacterium]|nr:hypothetical protein [Patescibacteria group bacterium]
MSFEDQGVTLGTAHTGALIEIFENQMPHHALGHIGILPGVAIGEPAASGLEPLNTLDEHGVPLPEKDGEENGGTFYRHSDVLIRQYPAPHQARPFSSRQEAELHLAAANAHLEILRETAIALPETYSQVVERQRPGFNSPPGAVNSGPYFFIETIAPWIDGEPITHGEEGSGAEYHTLSGQAAIDYCESLWEYYDWVLGGEDGIDPAQDVALGDLTNLHNYRIDNDTKRLTYVDSDRVLLHLDRALDLQMFIQDLRNLRVATTLIDNTYKNKEGLVRAMWSLHHRAMARLERL